MTYSVATGQLRVELDEASGRIVSVRNLARDLELVSVPQQTPPFRLELGHGEKIETFDSFRCEPLATGLRLIWTTAHSVTITSDVITRGDDILLRAEANNGGQATIDRLEYPIISGIGRLGGAGQDELAHTHATGMLFHDPLDLFEEDPENKRRLRYSPYPEGFSGSTMQFMAYYAREKGGFFIGTEDGQKGMKWFNFFKEGDHLQSTIIHKASVLEAGRSLTPPYAVVLSALSEGTWYEAGDRYRRWVFNQAWAQPGPRSKWLREEVGICTFGINARYDRSDWYNEIGRMAGVPVFHVLGPNWAHWGHDYHNVLPRGKADWFPAVFHEKNLEAIKSYNGRWAPFEFDLLCALNEEYPDPVLENRMKQNDAEFSISDPHGPHFPFMCAGTEYWHDWHVERDRKLVAEYGPNALYYDISVSNILMQCLATNHRHEPGAGTEIVEAFTTMYRDTSAAMAQAKGEYVPAGTEVISELFLNVFDYYQARAESGPYAPFEHGVYRQWIIGGQAEKIPLFNYVFGERAPLRMDGWAKLSPEAGDLFYWTASQILLNGGLFQLNYEFSALEDLNGKTDKMEEHYFRFAERRHSIDPAKAAFVGEVARTRVGEANRFLAYGRMKPAPQVDVDRVDLNYLTYNFGQNDPIYDDAGTMSVQGVLASAWELNGETRWLVANLLPQEQTATVGGKQFTLPGRKITLIEP